MEAVLLGKLWGWLLVILSVLLLVNGERAAELVRTSKERGYMLLAGMLVLILGLVTVLTHNVWTMDWRGLVTLLGWVAILKGVARIGFPGASGSMVAYWEGKTKSLQLLLVATFLIGAYVLWSVY